MKSLKVREWYMAQYPSDEMGEMILKNVTFFDVMGALLVGKCVYEVMMGVYGDSIVRERVFAKLAELHKVEYDVIYDLWLKA